MNVLVTGIAGFIGSHVADNIIKCGHTVIGIDDLSGGFIENVHKDANFIKGNICDRTLLDKLFKKYRFYAVYHLAAYAAEGLSHFIKHFNYENNLIGSINLLSCSVVENVKVFVFTSSIAVYGSTQCPMYEDTRPEPEDSYGIAKFAVEMELQATCSMFGLPYVIFRPHNVYGERQNIADRYRNVVGIFMRQALRGEPLTVFSDGLQTRAFSHVDDVAPIIASAIDNQKCWNQIFNIGADTPYKVLDIAELVSKALGVKKNIIHLPERYEVQHAYADHSKANEFFGVKPLISLEEGINRMAEWVKVRGIPAPTPAPPIEINRNLPSSW